MFQIKHIMFIVVVLVLFVYLFVGVGLLLLLFVVGFFGGMKILACGMSVVVLGVFFPLEYYRPKRKMKTHYCYAMVYSFQMGVLWPSGTKTHSLSLVNLQYFVPYM